MPSTVLYFVFLAGRGVTVVAIKISACCGKGM